MAERRATNKYYPPEWTPSKGSINKFVGQHPLRERAKHLDEGILVIRFELPFNIWCGGCGNHIAMGVRYNAQKKKVGMYYTTPILSFRMKCHLCDNWFVIQTDPKASDYVITEGARRKEETWDPEENGTIALPDEGKALRLAANPLARVENAVEDETKARTQATTTANLLALRDEDWKDDYESSKLLRKQFRERKKVAVAEEREAQAVADKLGLSIKVLPKAAEDDEAAAQVQFRHQRHAAAAALKRRRIAAKMGSIFGPGSAPAAARHKARAIPAPPPQGLTPAQLALLAQDRGINHRRFVPTTAPEAAPSLLEAQARVVAGSVVVTPRRAGAAAAGPATATGVVDYAGSSDSDS